MPNYSFNTQGPTVAQSAIDRILNTKRRTSFGSSGHSFNTPTQSVNQTPITKPIVKPSMNVFPGLQKPWEKNPTVAQAFNNPNALGKEKGVFTSTPTPTNPNMGTQTGSIGNNTNIGNQNNQVGSSTTQTPPVQPIPPVTIPPVTQNTTPSTPQVGDTMHNAQNELNAGQMTPEERYWVKQAMAAANTKNYQSVAPYAEAQFANVAPDSVTLPDITGPDNPLHRAGSQALYSNLAGIYSNTAMTGLSNAQNQANRAQTSATNVLQAGLPQLTSPGQVPFNSLTGQEGPITGTQNGGNGLLVQGNLAQLPQLQQQYTTMTNNLGSINGIENLLSSSLGGNQNISDINVINQAVNKLKSHTSSPEYNQFKTLLGSLGQLYSGYLSGSGQETDTTRQLAQSLIDGTASAATIKSVLDTLKSEGMVRLNQLHSTIQNISNNPSYLPNPNSGGQSSSGSTGATSAGGFNFQLVNGQWVPA